MSIEQAKAADTPHYAALVEAAAKAIMAADASIERGDAVFRAAHLARKGALALTSEGAVAANATHADLIRQLGCGPALLGEAPGLKTYDKPATSDAERVRRAKEREAFYAKATGRPTAKRVDLARVNAKMADAIAADPSLTRSPNRRATLREQFMREAYSAAGVALGSLDANGVSS